MSQTAVRIEINISASNVAKRNDTLLGVLLSFSEMDQAAYRAFCDGNEKIPLFMRPYWLDAVAPGGWNALISRDNSGEIVGTWALGITRQRGMTAAVLPPMTPHTGIYLELDTKLPRYKYARRRQRILEDLIDQLPDVRIFEQKLHWSMFDAAPFHWAGYKTEVRYTFRFETTNVEQLLSDTSKSFRRNLRSAERKFRVEISNDPSELFSLVDNVFELRADQNPFTRENVASAYKALSQRSQCTIYHAVDEDGPQSVIFSVWDDSTTYYLLGGRTGSNTQNSANLLLIRAMEDAEQRGHSFDFEGSMIEGVHKFFQKFGAAMTPYLYVYKYTGPAMLKYLK